MLPFKIKDIKPRCNDSEQKFWIMWPLVGMHLSHFWQKLVWMFLAVTWINCAPVCEVIWAHSRL